MSQLIKPHGSETLNPLFVMDAAKRSELIKEAEGLPSVVVCSAAAANAVMMGGRLLQSSKRLHECSRCHERCREHENQERFVLSSSNSQYA